MGLVWWDWCVSITPFLALRSDAWEVRILHSHLAFRQSGRGEPQDPAARPGVGYCLGIGLYCGGPVSVGEVCEGPWTGISPDRRRISLHVVHPWHLQRLSGNPSAPRPVRKGDEVGLPPRYLSGFCRRVLCRLRVFSTCSARPHASRAVRTAWTIFLPSRGASQAMAQLFLGTTSSRHARQNARKTPITIPLAARPPHASWLAAVSWRDGLFTTLPQNPRAEGVMDKAEQLARVGHSAHARSEGRDKGERRWLVLYLIRVAVVALYLVQQLVVSDAE